MLIPTEPRRGQHQAPKKVKTDKLKVKRNEKAAGHAYCSIFKATERKKGEDRMISFPVNMKPTELV